MAVDLVLTDVARGGEWRTRLPGRSSSLSRTVRLPTPARLRASQRCDPTEPAPTTRTCLLSRASACGPLRILSVVWFVAALSSARNSIPATVLCASSASTASWAWRV